jgi:hypothetical protein
VACRWCDRDGDLATSPAGLDVLDCSGNRSEGVGAIEIGPDHAAVDE